MDDGSPTLEVGFAIETGGSFDELIRLQSAMDSTEAKVVADAAKIERVTSGMLNLGGATASITSFANAATKEAQATARELGRVEKAGEALSRQMGRDAAAFGKSRDELRSMKVEAAAAAAEQQGLSELAQRLRAQEATLYDQKFAAARQVRFEAEAAAQAEERAAAQATVAMQAQADAAQRLAREHAQLSAMVRGSHAAQEADAVAADRLRMATDPLYAATSRLNAEIAESTRLYYAGATAPAEYARQQEFLTGRLREVERQHQIVNRGMGTVGVTGKLAGHHMQNLAFQFQDLSLGMGSALASSEPVKMMLMTVAQQGLQIQGIMSQAGIGIRGVGAAFATMSKGILLATVTNPILLGIAAAIAVVAGSIKLLQNVANDGANMEAYAASLGLTAKEIRNLDNVTVTFGDTTKAVFQVAGRAMWDAIGPAVTDAWGLMKGWIDWIGTGVKAGVNFLVGGFVGAYNAITKSWESFPAVMGDVFYSAVNVSISAINTLVQKAVDGLNFFIGAANGVLEKVGLRLPELSAPQIAAVENQFAGAGANFGNTLRQELQKAVGVDYLGNVADAISEQARKNARDRIRDQALEKGYLDPEKEKATKKKISDEQKAYEAALKAANDYIAAQQKETAQIGKSAKEIRLMEDAIQRMNAPLESQKLLLDQVAASREAAYSAKAATDFNTNVLQPIRDELALYGLVGPARDAAALALEKQSFLAANMDDGIEIATTRWVEYYRLKRELIDKDAAAEREIENARRLADEFDRMIDAADRAADGVARAFGGIGSAIANVTHAFTDYAKERQQISAQVRAETLKQVDADKLTGKLQLSLYGDLAEGAKGFFDEKSKGYQALAIAEKAFRAIEFALSIRAVAQDAIETIQSVFNSGARSAAAGTEGVANQSKLPFPFNIAAMAATAAALIAAGVSIIGGFGGGGGTPPETNTGTGTVLGDPKAQSESIKRSIDALKEVDTIMLTTSRGMAASLRSIDEQIGGVASLIVRAGNVDASQGVTEGFKPNFIGSLLGNIPVIGGFLSSLFGSSTNVIGSGLYGKAQSVGGILSGGFDAQYYSDIEKKSKFLGITTGTSRSTQYTGASAALEDQFTLIFREFNNAILAAAGPLGQSTTEIAMRLNSFVVSIGKIDTRGLTGEQIQEKLSAVFGAAADRMATAAFPGIDRFQKVGEGAFETLVRVASTVEAVTASLSMLGSAAQALGIDAKMGLAAQFESVGDFTGAAQAYFERFYTPLEQAQARLGQFGDVFAGLGLAMPSSLAGFRALVEAQDLTTTAGQRTYATLLQLAPAFADLQEAMNGARSETDILAERIDLERRLLELQGDTTAIRALELAKLDASNRALQQQIWAMEDAQEAARAADELRRAWGDVGRTIEDEVRRIRGLSNSTGVGGFAALQGQFNAATLAARGGDVDAAKQLPGLSQALLKAAAESATSRQELSRVEAQTAAALEATMRIIAAFSGTTSPATSAETILAAVANNQAASPAPQAANDTVVDELRALREEMAQLRSDNNAGHAATAGNTGGIKRHLDNVTAASGGEAISVAGAA